MSLTFDHGLAQPARNFLIRTVDGFLTGREWLRRYLAIRRTRRALDELPDWVLRDIGIYRGDIHQLAVRTYDRPAEDARRAWRSVS